MNELKPCPFCGGKAYLYVGDNGVCVICAQCEAQTRKVKDWFSSGKGTAGNATQTVIERWNRRVNNGRL